MWNRCVEHNGSKQEHENNPQVDVHDWPIFINQRQMMAYLGKPCLDKHCFTILPTYQHIHTNDTYLFCDEVAFWLSFKFWSFYNSKLMIHSIFVLKLCCVFLRIFSSFLIVWLQFFFWLCMSETPYLTTPYLIPTNHYWTPGFHSWPVQKLKRKAIILDNDL